MVTDVVWIISQEKEIASLIKLETLKEEIFGTEYSNEVCTRAYMYISLYLDTYLHMQNLRTLDNIFRNTLIGVFIKSLHVCIETYEQF